jgi:hypothetical protein
MKKAMRLARRLGVLILVLGLWGCLGYKVVKDEPAKDQAPQPALFQDVSIPPEMKMDRDDSFVFETSGFKAGTLIFRGYVEPDSVSQFFRETMPREGWTLKTIFRHPKTVLLFEKMSPVPKTCIVIVYEQHIFTHLEVWVAPQV